jgi:hypothetical protein
MSWCVALVSSIMNIFSFLKMSMAGSPSGRFNGIAEKLKIKKIANPADLVMSYEL